MSNLDVMLRINHPSNNKYFFEWYGGYSVEVFEAIRKSDGLPDHQIVGGFTIPTKNYDEAFAEIMSYIEENPWMEN